MLNHVFVISPLLIFFWFWSSIMPTAFLCLAVGIVIVCSHQIVPRGRCMPTAICRRHSFRRRQTDVMHFFLPTAKHCRQPKKTVGIRAICRRPLYADGFSFVCRGSRRRRPRPSAYTFGRRHTLCRRHLCLCRRHLAVGTCGDSCSVNPR